MFRYIYKDIASVVQYFPAGLAIGVPIAVVLLCLSNRSRKKRGEEKLRTVPFMSCCIYFIFMVVLTLLSRESGSAKPLDLELFSTLNINTRNTAYVAENILLFLPFGMLSTLSFKVMRNPVLCTLFGIVTSFGIETAQLFTGRGIFQVDDIWTNTVGMVLGCLLMHLLMHLHKTHRNRRQAR